MFDTSHTYFPTDTWSSQQIEYDKETTDINAIGLGDSWSLEFGNFTTQWMQDFKSSRQNHMGTKFPSKKLTNGTVHISPRNLMKPVFMGAVNITPSPTFCLNRTSESIDLPSQDLDWDSLFASLETSEDIPEVEQHLMSGGNGVYSTTSDDFETAEENSLAVNEPGVLDVVPDRPVFQEDAPFISSSSVSEERTKTRITRRLVEPKLLPSLAADYCFQDDNPFDRSLNPFEEGMEIVRNDGNLSLAVLAFEAACQQGPSHFNAWRMLGSVQSENEEEPAAINALKEALKLDPTSLKVLMKLAISYTNEGITRLAQENLEKWLRLKYPNICIPEFGPRNYHPTFSQSLERIKAAFIEAAQLSVTTDTVDPDVQVGLGVLLFSAQHYQMASDCFASAIQSSVPGTTNTSSQLHLLWNRYGACLGNLKQHDQGIEAYEMALAIRPNFVRARYNLSLLYQNKGESLLAAKNTVRALVERGAMESKTRRELEMLKVVKVGTSHGRLEEVMKRDEPRAMLETLRKCCGSLCRWDLAEAVGMEMDLRWFQKELDML